MDRQKKFRFYIVFISSFYATASFGATATLSFESPRGGEVYTPGQVQTVRLGAKTAAKTVKIELSRDGGTTFEQLGFIDNKAKDPEQRNALKFTVAGTASPNCVLRASGMAGKATVSVLSSPFTIGTITQSDGVITPAKINSGSSSSGFVLSADGTGGASFGPLPFDARYVKVAGDTMTGLLTLSGAPTANLHAATKIYVDTETSRAQGAEATLTANLNNELTRATAAEVSRVAKAGDTMTGALNLPANGLSVGTSQLTVANGNVGIGTSNPGTKLSVTGNATITGTTTSGSLTVGNVSVSNACTITNNQGGAVLTVTATTGGRPGTFTVMNGGAQPALAVNSDSVGTAALQVTDTGGGQAVSGTNSGTGIAGEFRITNAANTNRALFAATSGTGPAFVASQLGASGDIAIFEGAPATNVARIDKTGKGFFNGGTQMGGADLAEAFDVEGDTAAYSAGDVLVISKKSDRTVTKSTVEYSTCVSGVFATKPGVLLTEDGNSSDKIPMGVIGVIPTKVCTTNGVIRRGDLLVTSSLPGCAMKGTDKSRMLGAIIGKALENFSDSTPGKILVLINVK